MVLINIDCYRPQFINIVYLLYTIDDAMVGSAIFYTQPNKTKQSFFLLREFVLFFAFFFLSLIFDLQISHPTQNDSQ